MTLPVYWHDGAAELLVGQQVELTGREGHHASVVRRARPGDRVLLSDGAGARADCEVLSADKRGLTLLVHRVGTDPEAEPHVCVVQAIPKGDRADLAVEMLTEVGVDTIVPWAAERCVVVWRGERGDKSLAKWRRTAHEAAKQARRTRVPDVRAPASTEEVAELLRDGSVPVVLHEEAHAPLGRVPMPHSGRVVVVVGPEGGISQGELERFVAAGADPVRLGGTVLRTSTAGVAAVSALLARTPRWGATD